MTRRSFVLALFSAFVLRWKSWSVRARDGCPCSIPQRQAFIIESLRGQIYISDEFDVQDTPVYDLCEVLT